MTGNTSQAVLLCLILLSGSASASGNDSLSAEQVINTLRELVDSGQSEKAFTLASSERVRLEGYEEFDFYYGLAAAQTGHFQEALFPFERLTDLYPDNLRFRLELARALFYTGNYRLAEREFLTVLNQNPPEGVARNITLFMERIYEAQQQVVPSSSGGLSVAFGHDSNVNAATDLDTIQATFLISDTPINGVLTLSDEQKAQSSNFTQLQGYLTHQRPLSKRSSMDVAFSSSHKENVADEEYDLTSISFTTGIRFLTGRHSIRTGGIYRHFWLGGDQLQSQGLGNIRWNWLLDDKWQAGAEAEAGHQNNDQNNALDFYQWQALIYASRSHGSLSQRIQIGTGDDMAVEKENRFQGRQYIATTYQLQAETSADSHMYLLLNYRNNKYSGAFDDSHPFFPGETRKDELTQVIAGWKYRIFASLNTKIQLTYADNKSNLSLYEYDRTLFETGISLSF